MFHLLWNQTEPNANLSDGNFVLPDNSLPSSFLIFRSSATICSLLSMFPGPWEKALPIAHYALRIVSQWSQLHIFSPANQCAMRSAQWAMLSPGLTSVKAAFSRYLLKDPKRRS